MNEVTNEEPRSLRAQAVPLTPAAHAALNTDPSEIIHRWLAGLSDETARSYRRSMTSFARWALAEQDAPPERALELLIAAGAGPAHRLVEDWRDSLLGTGKSTGTVSTYVSGVASLVKACRRAGMILWRLEQVAPRRENREDRSGPHRADVEQLVEHLDRYADEMGDVIAARDAAIVRLLYTAAMRRNEVSGLLLRHVQLDHAEGPSLLVKRKGNRERECVLISVGCVKAIGRWLSFRRRSSEATGPLFIRMDRARGDGTVKPLSGEAVRVMLRRRTAEAGVRATIRPHGLRHSAATQVASCASVGTLMAVGGWKSLTAARNYLDRRQEERRRGLAILEV